jgi:DNA repair exonuclease SbcCD ATPase subunit
MKQGGVMESPKSVSMSMTKKEIIEEYNRLLDELKEKAAAKKEAASRLTELEKRQSHAALDAGLETTVDSVLEGTNRLRALLVSTLSELGDKMSGQAEKLEQLNRAVELQEARLKELHDIEYAADTMSRLAAAYTEEKGRIETEYEARSSELEQEYGERQVRLEKEFNDIKTELEQDMEKRRSSWEMEKEDKERERAREKAEYEYERDRTRRLEEDQYSEKRAELEKALRSMREEAEKEIADKRRAIEDKEQEFQRMSSEIEGFSERLEAAVAQARKQVGAEVEREMEHKAALKDAESQGKRQSLEQRISHLQEINKSLEKRMQDLTSELGAAHRQINMIAEKAVEGTSIAKAFEPVLERMRTPADRTKETQAE